MSNPQQPELGRSRKTPNQDPDAAASVLEAQSTPKSGGPAGPVPPENQPGHHPDVEQDKPDMDAFAERIGVTRGSDEEPASTTSAEPQSIADKRKPALIGAGASVVTLAGIVFLRRRKSRKAA